MNIDKTYRRLLEQYGNGDIDRRAFLGVLGRMAAACGVGASTLGAMSRATDAAQAVRFDAFGSTSQANLDKNVIKPFTAKTGIPVNQGSYGSEDELLAKVITEGPGAYNVFVSSDLIYCLRFAHAGQVEEIDEKKIPRLANVTKRAVDEYRKLSKNGQVAAVPYYLTGVSIAYNRDVISEAEMEQKGSAILIDPKFKGKVTGEGFYLRRIWYGALQTGQDPNNIKDINVIWDKIRESKRNVLKYWASSAEQQNLLATREVILADAWFARIFNLRRLGHPINRWPATGISVGFGSFVPIKGCPMDAFYEMADILLQPEVQIAQATATGNVTMLNPTIHPMPPEVQELIGYDPTGKLEGYHTVNPAYWIANSHEWQREYNRVIARA